MIKKSILIIDDSKLNLMIMEDILVAEGFNVKCLDTNIDILQKVMNIKPDIILLDLVMPHMDGFDVCKILKNEPAVSFIPIIIVTADTNPVSIKKALNLGAFDYIKKPFESIEVIARVHSAIAVSEYEEKLRHLALKDGLTCLYNKKAFTELFKRELANQIRNEFNSAFLIIDIDNFKTINDTYGHQCGDSILRELAFLLVSSVRECDIVGRYGGEEFCILLTNISKKDSENVCERIIKTIENNKFNYSKQTINVTVSVGAIFNKSDKTINTTNIIKIADDNLYTVKRTGKNNYKLT